MRNRAHSNYISSINLDNTKVRILEGLQKLWVLRLARYASDKQRCKQRMSSVWQRITLSFMVFEEVTSAITFDSAVAEKRRHQTSANQWEFMRIRWGRLNTALKHRLKSGCPYHNLYSGLGYATSFVRQDCAGAWSLLAKKVRIRPWVCKCQRDIPHQVSSLAQAILSSTRIKNLLSQPDRLQLATYLQPIRLFENPACFSSGSDVWFLALSVGVREEDFAWRITMQCARLEVVRFRDSLKADILDLVNKGFQQLTVSGSPSGGIWRTILTTSLIAAATLAELYQSRWSIRRGTSKGFVEGSLEWLHSDSRCNARAAYMTSLSFDTKAARERVKQLIRAHSYECVRKSVLSRIMGSEAPLETTGGG